MGVAQCSRKLNLGFKKFKSETICFSQKDKNFLNTSKKPRTQVNATHLTLAAQQKLGVADRSSKQISKQDS
jgi:hypothetical protein